MVLVESSKWGLGSQVCVFSQYVSDTLVQPILAATGRVRMQSAMVLDTSSHSVVSPNYPDKNNQMEKRILTFKT